jgi:hypothetical protein
MKSVSRTNAEFVKYNNALSTEMKDICDTLMREIDEKLINSTSKMYHSNPVWFINDNPVVGYNVTGNGIALLFWSGQSFKTPGLEGIGKFKAAKIKYIVKLDIDLKLLRTWLKESVEIQWDYKNIRTNGKLVPIAKM